LTEAIAMAKPLSAPVWCTADAISESDYKSLGERNISRFVYSNVGGNPQLLGDILEIIADHHSGERIWVEHVSQP